MVQIKKDAVRARILDAVARLFEEIGYVKASMSASANIYVYFPSKAEVAFAIFEPWFAERIERFVEHYNHQRYHESLNNLTPADVYFGRGQSILAKRKMTKKKTIAKRRLHYQRHAA